MPQPLSSFSPRVRAPTFSRGDACRIVGVPLSTLLDWERHTAAATGCRSIEAFTLADLLLLAVMREMAGRLGPGLTDFTFGLRRLSDTLATHPDVERLSDLSAVIARDFAQLCELREGHVRCDRGDIVVVPLRLLLADFRDQAFA